jgi:hypothetical protein
MSTGFTGEQSWQKGIDYQTSQKGIVFLTLSVSSDMEKDSITLKPTSSI